MSRSWLAKLAVALAIPIPSVVLHFAGIQLPALAELFIYGAAVVASAVLLAWAAETAQMDISASLAIALLALIAVLPEYAVDLYFAYTAGHNPDYAQYAAANMTGSNRLLIGIGWPLVALVLAVAVRRARKREGQPAKASFFNDRDAELRLRPRRRIELAFLAMAGVFAFLIPITGRIGLLETAVLLSLYAWYIWRIAKEEKDEPHLIGVSAKLGLLRPGQRRFSFIGLFVAAAVFVLSAAEPFANALVHTGQQFGIDEFLLVQWLAPLASEAPELIVAFLLAWRLEGDNAMGALLSSKVNQWTLLIGTLPIAYMIGGGGTALIMDTRQVEEFFLTAAQTVLGFSILANLRFSPKEAIALLALFLLQFPFPQTSVRLGFSALYIVLAVGMLIHQRRSLGTLMSACYSRAACVECEESLERAEDE